MTEYCRAGNVTLPPAVDDLLRDAARNHQLERAFFAERTAARAKRSETERAGRTEVAGAFLSDPAQRALIRPSPSPRRCYVATPFGRMRFDVATDDGPARDVPREAFRRFRADVDAARTRRANDRAEDVRVHEARQQAIAAWVAEHGSDDQRGRHAAGLLPPDEVIDAITDNAFRPLASRRRYSREDNRLFLAHVQHWTGRDPEPLRPADVVIVSHPARSATGRQWALLQDVQAAVPDAVVRLHVREFLWRRDPGVPRFTRLTRRRHQEG